MSAPLDVSIIALLRDSALGAIADRPVTEVLSALGLPGLPQIPPLPPMPELPPLPVLDLGALLKPMTDLAGSFGTGIPGVGPGPDPSQVLPQVVSTLEQATQLGTTAAQTVMSTWEGAGAASAADKAARTAADTTEVAAQGTRMKADHAAAATSVFTGYAQVTAIMSKYLASLAAAGPFLATPPGQAFVAASTADTMAQVTAVIAKTRAELTVHTAEVSADGRKVPVTEVPPGVTRMGAPIADSALPLSSARGLPSASSAVADGLDPTRYVTQILQMVQGLSAFGATGAQVAGHIGGALPERHDAVAPLPIASAVPITAPVVSGAPTTAAAPVAPPLQEAKGATLLAGGGTASPAAPIASPAVSTASAGSATPLVPGPMGASGAMARATGSAGDALRGDLVNAAHGNEVVGALADTSVPVIGAPETHTTTRDDREPPDKALTL